MKLITSKVLIVMLKIINWLKKLLFRFIRKVDNMSTVGKIEYDVAFGALEIINEPATKLPQDVATAMGTINEGFLGATYTPIWVIGRQLVNGFNYHILCKEVRSTRTKQVHIVNIVINIPPVQSDNTKPKAEVVSIVEEVKLPADIQEVFDAGTAVAGVQYKPIAYVGKQLVNGTNYYFICQARIVYPGSEPFAAFVTVNKNLNGNSTLLSVEPIPLELLGYAFTWLK